MAKEQVDPLYEYVDTKIKGLKDNLSKEFISLHNELLQTQQFLAQLSVRVTHNESIRSPAYKKAESQFVSEVTSALLKISTSKKPLPIAGAFVSKRWDDLQKLGAKSIHIKY